MNDINIFEDKEDTSIMTKEEFTEYGVRRLKIMLQLKENAVKHLIRKNTPLQALVLETAEHRVLECEQRFGISRYDLC